MAQKLIDIVIVSYYRKEFTRECIDAIKGYTTTPHRIIVVDNDSDNWTQRELLQMKMVGKIDILLLLDKNYGLEPAKNFGLQFVESDWYIDSDNDILVPPSASDGDWLERLLRLKDKHPSFLAIACPPQVFIGADKAEMFKDAPEVVERAFVGGSMRLMKTADVRNVGGWRQNPKDMNEANRGEEHYICGKLRKLSYNEGFAKVGYARDIEVFHMFGDDSEWGYGKTEHYHRDQWPRPTDKMFITKEKWYEKYCHRS